MKENIETKLKKALVEFIIESTEDDYNTGYWLGEIIESQLSISREMIVSGLIDKINEFQARIAYKKIESENK